MTGPSCCAPYAVLFTDSPTISPSKRKLSSCFTSDDLSPPWLPYAIRLTDEVVIVDDAAEDRSDGGADANVIDLVDTEVVVDVAAAEPASTFFACWWSVVPPACFAVAETVLFKYAGAPAAGRALPCAVVCRFAPATLALREVGGDGVRHRFFPGMCAMMAGGEGERRPGLRRPGLRLFAAAAVRLARGGEGVLRRPAAAFPFATADALLVVGGDGVRRRTCAPRLAPNVDRGGTVDGFPAGIAGAGGAAGAFLASFTMRERRASGAAAADAVAARMVEVPPPACCWG